MLSKDGGEGKGKAIARPGACLLEGRAWELEPTASAHCILPAIPIHSSVSLSKIKVPAFIPLASLEHFIPTFSGLYLWDIDPRSIQNLTHLESPPPPTIGKNKKVKTF